MKTRRKIGPALLTALTMVVALAAGSVSVRADDVPGVVKGGDSVKYAWDQSKNDWGDSSGSNTFLKDAPIGTITIDTASLNITRNNNYTFSTTNDKFYIDTDSSHTRTVGKIVYNDSLTANGAAFDVDGSFTLVFADSATLQDGSKADVTITYSNMHIAPGARDVTGPINNITGSFVGPTNNVPYNPEDPDNPHYPGYGLRCDINVKVTKNGEGVPGTVLFSTVDLDVAGNDSYSDSSSNDNYRESFEILSGAVSEAYIPSGSYISVAKVSGSSNDGNGVKFTSVPNPKATNASGDPTYNDNGTYESGFAVLTDAAQGITLRWWGQGSGMGTSLFTGNISHKIESTTTKGGSIKTTTSGNPGGDLSDGDELGPVNIDVPDGKTVIYTMEPEDGYELSKLVVDGTEVDVSDLADGASKTVTLADGTAAKVTKNADGTYNFEFPNNQSNHTIDVSWDPIVTAKSASGGSITDPGDTTVPFGTDKTYTATPDEGYGLKTVKYNGKEVDPEDPSTWPVDDNGDPVLDIVKNDDGSYSITLKNVEDPASLEVEWVKLHTVTFENGDHGTSTGGNQTGVPEGDYPEGGNKVTPNSGYQFSGKYKYVITKDDGTTEEGETDDPTKIPVTGDIVFTPIYDPIVTATSGTGGGISDPGDTSVSSGSSKTYTFTPEPGFTIGKVTVNGKEVTPVDNGDGTWSYTIDDITEPTTIDVQWTPLVWVKYVDEDGNTIYMPETYFGKGGEEPAGPPAPTKEGYEFDGWERTVDENGNVTYTAKWKKIVKPVPSTTPTNTTKAAPKTGDNTNVMLFVVTILFCMVGVMTAVTSRRNVVRSRRKK